jgi:hypothetical protein
MGDKLKIFRSFHKISGKFSIVQRKAASHGNSLRKNN